MDNRNAARVRYLGCLFRHDFSKDRFPFPFSQDERETQHRLNKGGEKEQGKKDSPTLHSSTASPSATTSPELSCPNPNSPVTFELPIPPCFQKCTSLPQIPVARTWMRTSPFFGVGVGTGVRVRVCVGEVVMARLGLRLDMVFWRGFVFGWFG